MLYKYLFSILCGHLNLNQIFFEFDRLPVKPTGKPVKPTGKSVGTGWTCEFEFELEFDRFPAKPVRYTGTGPRRFDRTGRLIKPWA